MKGICFIEPLFHATVEGRKMKTRRIIKHAGNKMHYGRLLCHWGLSEPPRFDEKENEWIWHLQTDVDDSGDFRMKNPRHNVGEVLYLKEPYRIDEIGDGYYKLSYMFDPSEKDTRIIHIESEGIKWNEIESVLKSMKKSKNGFANKLFMYEWAARYFIRIIAVRAERLQDISDDDCFKEGIIKNDYEQGHFTFTYKPKGDEYSTPQQAYAALIDNINGRGTWDSNPWVWVYDYILTEKP